MKKIIIILLVLALCGGIGFVGYTVFVTKNIEKVEYEAEIYKIESSESNSDENSEEKVESKKGIQTLYIVDETATPKFHDAELKVTYKGGEVKFIKLQDAYDKGTVTVTDFSTSIEAQRTMKINYKSNIIEVKYNVIRSGMYYVNSYNRVTASSNFTPSEYTLKTTNEMFEISSTGEFKYYKKNTGTEWYLYDGTKIPSYRYEILGDKINLYLGNQEPAYTVNVERVNGVFKLSAINTKFNKDGILISRETKTLLYTDSKTNATVNKDELAKQKFVFKNNSNITTHFNFYYGETIADRMGDIYLKVTYNTPIVSYDTLENSEPIIQTLLVVAHDSMIYSGHEFDTKSFVDKKPVSLWYAGYEFKLNYKVLAKDN